MRVLSWLEGNLLIEERAQRVIHWPTSDYLGRPEQFAREILGSTMWAMQAEILRALTKVNDDGIPCAHVIVRSCNGVGKTFLAAAAALYWHTLWADSQIICSAPVMRQVEDQLWKLVRVLHARSGVCWECRRDGFKGRQCEHSTRLDGEVARSPETGYEVGFRKLKAFAAVDKNRATGYEGIHQLWIGDEAAGLREDWLEAAQSALKGGGAILAIGNPTELSGFHAAAFRVKHKEGERRFWTDTFTISALDSPNVRAGRSVIPGLVTREWVENCKLLWGENSDLYRIRVLGVHPEHSSGMLVTFTEIDLLHARWAPDQKPGEGLAIGLDVAAFNRSVDGHTVAGSSGVAGDQWVLTAVRGSYTCDVQKWRTMTPDELVARLVDVARKWRRRDNERVTVRYDAEGAQGAECQRWLEYVSSVGHQELSHWDLVAVKVSTRMGKESPYGTVRDAAYANLATWIREGGSYPVDDEFDDELAHTWWRKDPHGGKDRVDEKSDIKERLPHRRSPDTLESLMLAVWSGQPLDPTDRMLRDSPNYREPWMDGLPENQLPRSKYDPGQRYAGRSRR